MAMVGGTALAALSLVLAPAFAASTQFKAKKKASVPTLAMGGFTPAVADPRLAALFANRGLSGGSFHFTPSATPNGSKAVKVAVRARAATTAEAMRTGGEMAGAVDGLTPTAYNLGVAVGWKQFALSGDVAKVAGGLLPAGREAAEVGISYAGKKFTGRLQVGAERPDGRQLRILPQESSYSVDLGGSYSLARNLDLTGGVRYRIQHDRLERIDDERRDSQAVYIGTAFRF
ncbi:MAG: hypothetical protein JWN69_2243 [Alphaproteobacteria bacterium]|nr:hypothetical protein [Alphaproteobacteria bacterium]